jgi:hypothetical protein
MKHHTRLFYLDYLRDKERDLLAVISKTECKGKLAMMEKMLNNLLKEIYKKQS